VKRKGKVGRERVEGGMVYICLVLAGIIVKRLRLFSADKRALERF
jgi:hypothetical protein